ncbi:MAG TPA: ABC transporter, partial [Sutterella sp.]|nr:ABC transporter [Sutterella sp.]
PDSSVNRREERRLEAQERARKAALKKPLQKKLDTVEKDLQSVRSELDSLDAKIADAAWYQSAPQDEVSETMRRRGELAARSDELELEWLEISEKIEEIG